MVDVVRGLTILWVTALHFYVDTRGVPGADVASAGAAWAALMLRDFPEVAAVLVRSIVGLPGFRLDLLLFVTALVATQGTPVSLRTFYARRLRAILPQYWLGTLAVLGVCVAFAALRAGVGADSFSAELHEGARLGTEVYRFHGLDVLRSLTLVGRLEDARTMQVVAPSLWYIVLVAQLWLVFPWLSRLQQAIGTPAFLGACAVVTFAGRAWVFATVPLAGFDANATVICFLPFRLIAPALGMAVSRGTLTWLAGIDSRCVPVAAGRALSIAAAALLLTAMWLGVSMNTPGTVAGVLGPVPPLVLALPAIVWVAIVAGDRPHLGPLLRWAGTHSLSILVVQDVLRLGVGTASSLGLAWAPSTLPVMPVYIVVALLLARWWHPWPERLMTALDAQGSIAPGPGCSAASGPIVLLNGESSAARIVAVAVGAEAAVTEPLAAGLRMTQGGPYCPPPFIPDSREFQ